MIRHIHYGLLLLLIGLIGASGFRALAEKEIPIVKQHQPYTTDSITDVEWSPDYKLIATSQLDGTVIIRDNLGNILKTLISDKQATYTISWSPNGNQLAAGGLEPNIKIWDVAEGKIIQAIPAFAEGVFGLAWQPAGNVLLGSGFDYFRAWDTSTWQPLTKALSVTLYDMAWSPDSAQFAFAASNVGTAIIQKSGSVKVFTYAPQDDWTAPAFSVSWNSTGIQLVSGGRDGTVRLWDAVSGKQIKLLLQAKPDEWIQGVSFDTVTDARVIAVSNKGQVYEIDLVTSQIQQTEYDISELLKVDWNPIDNTIALGGTSTEQTTSSASNLEPISKSGVFKIIQLDKKSN